MINRSNSTSVAIRTALVPALLLGLHGPAAAVTMTFFSRLGTGTFSEPGSFAKAVIHEDEGMRGYGYESPGLIATYGSVDSVSRPHGPTNDYSDNIPQLTVSASSSDVFYNRLGANDDIGNGRYVLTVLVQANGRGTTSQTPAPNLVPMSAEANYAFKYCFKSACIEGGQRVVNSNGVVETIPTGVGAGGAFFVDIPYVIGDFTTVSFSSSVFSAAASYGGGAASSLVEFDRTLRWGGVTNVKYDAGGGNYVDAPDDFIFDLTSDDTGFNYWYAAGPNPFPNPFRPVDTPEPAGLALVGFGAAGVLLRRRRAA